ncbi:hypothetical protein AHiyo8_pI69490 (plasmid) [Arthrobacter sp. Hiyo8]|nr:hypothetical protein AHiyo8_pI69490 [Arthrobacter sp. Hiyo8]
MGESQDTGSSSERQGSRCRGGPGTDDRNIQHCPCFREPRVGTATDDQRINPVCHVLGQCSHLRGRGPERNIIVNPERLIRDTAGENLKPETSCQQVPVRVKYPPV